MEWSEKDILERLKDDAEDEHRNYIYPEQAQALLKLLQDKDKEIADLKRSMAHMVHRPSGRGAGCV